MACVVVGVPQPTPGCFGGTDEEAIGLGVSRVGRSSPKTLNMKPLTVMKLLSSSRTNSMRRFLCTGLKTTKADNCTGRRGHAAAST